MVAPLTYRLPFPKSKEAIASKNGQLSRVGLEKTILKYCILLKLYNLHQYSISVLVQCNPIYLSNLNLYLYF